VSKIASWETKRAKYNFKRSWMRTNIKKHTKSFNAYVRGKAKVGRNIGPLLNHQNKVADSAEGMSQEFNKFFSSFFTKEMSCKVSEAVWMYKENVSGLCDSELTEKKVLEKLDRLRDAAGADNLVPRFLNGIKHELVSPLVILDDKTVPSDWEEANVVPMFKGGQRSAASNYRPASLTSHICKMFEAVVRNKFAEFLGKQCIYAYTKANRVMGMIKRTILYKEPRIMLNLYKTLVGPRVECCSCAWNPYYSKDKDKQAGFY